MGLSHSPRAVTDGLVFCVDAANPRSYPETGSGWYDLSNNNYDGTLINGASFDSAGVRSFDVVTRPESAGYMAMQTFTSSATLGFTCEGGPGTPWPLNEWYHCTFVYRGGTSATDLDWYFNGVETIEFGWNYRYRFYDTTPDVDTDGERKFGDSERRNRYLNAYLANLQTYNRTLTDEEIKQNYNATKGRFGL